MFNDVSKTIKSIARAQVIIALALGVMLGIVLMLLGYILPGVIVLLVLPACAFLSSLMMFLFADINENLTAIRAQLAVKKTEEIKNSIVQADVHTPAPAPAPVAAPVAAPVKKKAAEAEKQAPLAENDAKKLVQYALRFTTDDGMTRCILAKLNAFAQEERAALTACLNAGNPREALKAWLEQQE